MKPKGVTNAFNGSEKKIEKTLWFSDLFTFKTSRGSFTAVKRNAVF